MCILKLQVWLEVVPTVVILVRVLVTHAVATHGRPVKSDTQTTAPVCEADLTEVNMVAQTLNRLRGT